MKAIITQKSELTLNLKQFFTFDIVGEDGKTILTSQAVESTPSQAVEDIKAKVKSFEEEYQISQNIPEGTEIE